MKNGEFLVFRTQPQYVPGWLLRPYRTTICLAPQATSKEIGSKLSTAITNTLNTGPASEQHPEHKGRHLCDGEQT